MSHDLSSQTSHHNYIAPNLIFRELLTFFKQFADFIIEKSPLQYRKYTNFEAHIGV